MYKELSNRNKSLLLDGAKTTGSFTEGYYYIEESLYVDEADELHTFCMWIDNQIGGAGPANIETLWLGFKYPEVDAFSKSCAYIKKQMDRIKSYSV